MGVVRPDISRAIVLWVSFLPTLCSKLLGIKRSWVVLEAFSCRDRVERFIIARWSVGDEKVV